jgi:ubiquinone biosynthesis protein
VGREFGGDIGLMAATVWLITRLKVRWLAWLTEPLREFIAWTSEEMDFRREAGYTARVGWNAQGSTTERIPQVDWSCTTRRTLVTEFLDGVTVLNYLRAVERGDEAVLGRLARQGFDPQVFAANIINNFLGDVFRHGMFHADLHPANLMILPGNVVGYLDFGITGVLSRYFRQHLIALTLAYTRGDTEGMCESFFKASAAPPGAEEGFREALLRMSDEWYDGHGRGRRLRKNFTGVMLDMMTLSRKHGVVPERDVIKYIRSAIAGDGLIARFAPGFNVSSHLERMCYGHLRWHILSELVSYEALLNWMTRGGALFQDGPVRSAVFVRRLASGELSVRSPAAATPGASAARPRGLLWAGLAFLLAVLVAVAGHGSESDSDTFAVASVAVGILAPVAVLAARRAD